MDNFTLEFVAHKFAAQKPGQGYKCIDEAK
jgi:hypothetical protein